MKIAVISDIHGNINALREVYKDIKKNKVDKILCLGDVIGFGPNSLECLDFIINNKIEMLLGNHEMYLLNGVKVKEKYDDLQCEHYNYIKSFFTNKYLDYLRKLDFYRIYDNILFCHFILDYKKENYPFYEGEYENLIDIIYDNKNDNIICGHIHFIDEIVVPNKLVIVGSLGCTNDNYSPYIIVDTKNKVIERKKVKYNQEEYIEYLLNKNYKGRNKYIKAGYLGDKVRDIFIKRCMDNEIE